MRFTYRQPVTYRASMAGGYGYEGRDIPAEFLRLSDTRKRAHYPNIPSRRRVNLTRTGSSGGAVDGEGSVDDHR